MDGSESPVDAEAPAARSLRPYRAPGAFIDSDHPAVKDFAARAAAGAEGPRAAAKAIHDRVRDEIRYTPYLDFADPESYRASSVLAAGTGYCVGKAALFAAACRATGIPARVGFADVRNHLATPELIEKVGTDLFCWHGYGEVFLNGRWVKASPTFNATLCAKLGVAVLAFDGQGDALLQPFDAAGRTFMAYEADHGPYWDVPVSFLAAEMARLYPRLCGDKGEKGRLLEAEAR